MWCGVARCGELHDSSHGEGRQHLKGSIAVLPKAIVSWSCLLAHLQCTSTTVQQQARETTMPGERGICACGCCLTSCLPTRSNRRLVPVHDASALSRAGDPARDRSNDDPQFAISLIARVVGSRARQSLDGELSSLLLWGALQGCRRDVPTLRCIPTIKTLGDGDEAGTEMRSGSDSPNEVPPCPLKFHWSPALWVRLFLATYFSSSGVFTAFAASAAHAIDISRHVHSVTSLS